MIIWILLRVPHPLCVLGAKGGMKKHEPVDSIPIGYVPYSSHPSQKREGWGTRHPALRMTLFCGYQRCWICGENPTQAKRRLEWGTRLSR